MTTNLRNILLTTTLLVGFGVAAASEAAAETGSVLVQPGRQTVTVRPAGANGRPSVLVQPGRQTVTVHPAGASDRPSVLVQPGRQTVTVTGRRRGTGETFNGGVFGTSRRAARSDGPAGDPPEGAVRLTTPPEAGRPADSGAAPAPAASTTVVTVIPVPADVRDGEGPRAVDMPPPARVKGLLRPLQPAPSIKNATYIGGEHSDAVCLIGNGPGPGGANLFFENCWWYAKTCTGADGRWTEYACQSCPDLSRAGTCPAGTTSFR